MLIISLFITLIRKKAYTPVIGVAAGLVMTSFWFVPLSLEYTWTYLLMLLLSIIGVRLMCRKQYQTVGIFFLISGMMTNYLDFLTAETLTLTVPLLLMLWTAYKEWGQSATKNAVHTMGKAVAAWGCGYAGMWMMKWILASVVLSENVMPYVTEHIGERIGGELGLNPFQYIFGAVWNNIKCIFPLEYGIIGQFIGIAMVIFVIYTGYVYHGKNIDKKCILLYIFIGLIPYIRYVVLHNHSYLHCFFTYRAQLATVLASVLVLEQLTKGVWKTHQ